MRRDVGRQRSASASFSSFSRTSTFFERKAGELRMSPVSDDDSASPASSFLFFFPNRFRDNDGRVE